ncbi:hypothetical protein A1O3_03965 [Capronia epimyces CBS 606.96]|uniref:Uncharacterized protein n=1 Tax=Capronia epimyces CBS 606.96 TaxID=1182542 RepID=W9Y3E1_9EURO|nr:uncharacterized protein A1O3_03965 [Capronia epimyces CBS 606.96]EXJ87008.1 hypothetical protein A1O3_03965 [Capronia epimyces CBS 606.96]
MTLVTRRHTHTPTHTYDLSVFDDQYSQQHAHLQKQTRHHRLPSLLYHLGQSKLDNECRRQTPDLHRIVAHASNVDSVRRWSHDLTELSETVPVDSSSDDEDSDPFKDCYEEEDSEYTAPGGDVAIFGCDIGDEDAHVIDAT